MKIIAFGAHPDDIEPQIGGTLAKFSKQNASVLNVIVSNTSTGSTSISREQEGKVAAKIIGAEYLSLGLDLNTINFRDLVNEIDVIIKNENPKIIFSVPVEDTHQDHKLVARAVEVGCRKNKISLIFNNQTLPGGIHSPVLNYFVDISEFQKLKIESCMAYESQIKRYGQQWLEAIEGRDKLWGFNIGTKFAEAASASKIINSFE